jgi:hypothetical protein
VYIPLPSIDRIVWISLQLASVRHVPLEQIVPAAQTFVHEPQCAGVLRLVSHPVDAVMSQLPQPVAHIPSMQLPAMHDAPALAKLQRLLQAPQLFGSVVTETSQPLVLLPSQFWNPVLQFN